MSSIQQPPIFNKHQLEILNLFKRNLDEVDLLAVKKLIVNYFAEKATNSADEIWEKNGWTNEYMEKLLNSDLREHPNLKRK